jgi:hypothetical protein
VNCSTERPVCLSRQRVCFLRGEEAWVVADVERLIYQQFVIASGGKGREKPTLEGD